MRRRALIGAAAATALATPARAQRPARIARIGYLSYPTAAQAAPYSDAFRTGLRDLGYVEGGNVRIEFRFADGDEDRLDGLAAELVALNVDVIVTHATGVFAARRATATIPIVFATGGDPVARGIAASLARPGGNVTGSIFFLSELMAKRLELMKQAVPSLVRAGVFLPPTDQQPSTPVLAAMGVPAGALGVELHPLEARDPAEFEGAFSTWAAKRTGAVVIHDHALFIINAGSIAALAAKHGLPSIGPPELAANGGLMAYGVNFRDMYRRAAVYVDKILKGANPGDLPIERATRFDLVINLRTARALGLTLPPEMFARADEVIE